MAEALTYLCRVPPQRLYLQFFPNRGPWMILIHFRYWYLTARLIRFWLINFFNWLLVPTNSNYYCWISPVVFFAYLPLTFRTSKTFSVLQLGIFFLVLFQASSAQNKTVDHLYFKWIQLFFSNHYSTFQSVPQSQHLQARSTSRSRFFLSLLNLPTTT